MVDGNLQGPPSEEGTFQGRQSAQIMLIFDMKQVQSIKIASYHRITYKLNAYTLDAEIFLSHLYTIFEFQFPSRSSLSLLVDASQHRLVPKLEPAKYLTLTVTNVTEKLWNTERIQRRTGKPGGSTPMLREQRVKARSKG